MTAAVIALSFAAGALFGLWVAHAVITAPVVEDVGIDGSCEVCRRDVALAMLEDGTPACLSCAAQENQ